MAYERIEHHIDEVVLENYESTERLERGAFLTQEQSLRMQRSINDKLEGALLQGTLIQINPVNGLRELATKAFLDKDLIGDEQRPARWVYASAECVNVIKVKGNLGSTAMDQAAEVIEIADYKAA